MCKAEVVRELIDVFDANPLSSSDKLEDFYVNASSARGENSAARLIYLMRNSSRQDKKILFMGHTGCGKSTELFKVAEELSKDYVVVQYSLDEYVDFLSTSYIDVVFSILHNITAAAEQYNIEINRDVLTGIYNYWKDEQVVTFTEDEKVQLDAEASISGNFFKIFKAKIKTFLEMSSSIKQETKRKIEPSFPRLLHMINAFVRDFSQKSTPKKLLVIIDDLDKLGLDQAKDIFIDHCRFMTSLDMNIVYTFPIYLFYSPDFRYIESNFDDIILLSMIKVKNRDGSPFDNGIDTLEKIIFRRAESNLFDKGVIRYVIEKSGGCIRYAFSIIREAAFIVELKYLEDDSVPEEKRIITMKDVQLGYRKIKSSLERCIRKDHIDILLEIHKSKKPVIDKDNLLVMELLQTLAVIEYNGERWCDLNPAIEDYLREVQIIKPVMYSENQNL